ncbi:MAG: segregation and condensation protein A [Mycobacteriales bacterium]
MTVPPPETAGTDAAAGGTGTATRGGFDVHLDNFEGPFDLLLRLIAKHKLDVTEVALSRVTDEFIAHIELGGREWDLGQATEFLVVAATLLDLKAARLLPAGDVNDEDDLALLEARDLLFARLLQYRAFKAIAEIFGRWEADAATRFPRVVTLEPRYANALPEVLLGIGAQQLARLAAEALAPKAPPAVSVDHLHAPRVSVREQADILRRRLASVGQATFRSLVADCEHTAEVVGRFLGLLELYREQSVAFDQLAPLGDLHVRWVGGDGGMDREDLPEIDEEYA